MDLNEVAIFIAVVEAASFTRAAEKLGIPKSSVSRRIAHLEEALGARLLQRTTRKLGLTDAGRVYYEEAARALVQLREAGTKVSELQDMPTGTLRIAAPPDSGYLAEMMVRFCQKYPSLHVELEFSGRHVDLVAEKFDVALRAGRLRDSSLVARKVVETVHMLVATPAYLARRGTPSALADLALHDCLLFRPSGGKNTWTLSGPGGDESVEVTGQLGADEFGFVRRALLADAGIALVPHMLVQEQLRERRLVRVLPDYASRGAALYVVYPSAQHLPRKVVAFRDFVLENFDFA